MSEDAEQPYQSAKVTCWNCKAEITLEESHSCVVSLRPVPDDDVSRET